MVFERLFKGRNTKHAAAALYDSVVQQARRPELYTLLGVPDTIDGRFDVLVLHVHLILRRLRGDGASMTGFAQALFDALFFDMDRTLRAMGVGDMSVGKRVKDMIRAYYGRAAAYDAALQVDDDALLLDALGRNVFAGAPGPDGGVGLARYVRRSVDAIAAHSSSDILAGGVRFPDLLPMGDGV
ncbi:MAG: hypothetical protein HQ481_05380 [Alphaproteobacteria bacterium]|nr:hypothetical protein [Alphaproteobacteria bacterium]